jgi:hypothetical protein
MAIADEVDSQLAQTMASYVAESKLDDPGNCLTLRSEGQDHVW